MDMQLENAWRELVQNPNDPKVKEKYLNTLAKNGVSKFEILEKTFLLKKKKKKKRKKIKPEGLTLGQLVSRFGSDAEICEIFYDPLYVEDYMIIKYFKDESDKKFIKRIKKEHKKNRKKMDQKVS